MALTLLRRRSRHVTYNAGRDDASGLRAYQAKAAPKTTIKAAKAPTKAKAPAKHKTTKASTSQQPLADLDDNADDAEAIDELDEDGPAPKKKAATGAKKSASETYTKASAVGVSRI